MGKNFDYAFGTVLLLPLAVLAMCGCVYIIKSTIYLLRGAKMCWYCDTFYLPKDKTEHIH